MPLNLVKEVISLVPITPIPKVPDFYKGLINLRGQIISIIDLRVKLGLKEAPIEPKKTCIIITHVGDIVVGSITDEVIEVVGYEPEQLDISENERVEKKGDGVIAVAKEKDGQLTLIIDIRAALENTEFNVLKDQRSA